jgi:hypothetical protein
MSTKATRSKATDEISYAVRALNPAHPDLANAAGVPARLSYVPTQPLLDGSYKLPNVERAR